MFGLSVAGGNFSAYRAKQAAPDGSQLKLVYTHHAGNDEATAYVFSKGDGFVIMTAQGEEPLMLGYSEHGVFDANNIPPALQEMMEAYSRNYVRMPASRSEKAAIEPLCTTKWGQHEPYNHFCPQHDGKNSLTGCGSTAMAQIMKYYEYPTSGRGSNTYTYRYNYNDYTLSQDFSQIVIEWGKMKDTYLTNYFGNESENAVARLMKYCGISSDSSYSPEATSTFTTSVLYGLAEFFKYDEGLSIEFREWYTDQEWEDMIYKELAEERPLLYRGETEDEEGHIFVCDGYMNDGYFHINWGWDGSCDGYFLLDALKPYAEEEYTYFQRAGIGIKPDEGGTRKFGFYINDIFGTNSDSYNRAAFETITFTGGFYSCSIFTEDVELGLKLSKGTEDEYIYLFNSYQLLSEWGWRQFYISSSYFPVGEYDVYPVARTIGSEEWQEMKHNLLYNNFLHFVVTEDNVEVSVPDSPTTSIGSALDEEDAPAIYYNLQGMPVANPENGVYIKVQGKKRAKVRL